MNVRAYAVLFVLMLATMGAIIGYSVANGLPLLALFSVVVGLVLLRILRGQVDEILEDELLRRVVERASTQTFQILLISCALIGTVLISFGNAYGYVLSYIACAGVLVYLVLYMYYRTRGVE